MDEEIIESANNLEVADQEETVESTVGDVVEAEETTEQSDVVEDVETTEQTEEPQAETKKPQSDEENSKYRLARIKAEKEAERKLNKLERKHTNKD